MVWEAVAAGLKFDKTKMANLTCCPDKIDECGNKDPDRYAKFHAVLHESGTGGYKVEAGEAEWANLRSSENEGFLQDV